MPWIGCEKGQIDIPEDTPIGVSVYLDGSDLLSEDQVPRKVIPVTNQIIRRGGGSA